MYLYKIERVGKRKYKYDIYLEAVVSAPSIDAARRMHPDDGKDIHASSYERYRAETWTDDVEDVLAIYLGTYAGEKSQVISASFNAG